VKEEDDMTKILLVGDSIRLSYMPRVKELLDGKAIVWGPEDNSRFVKYTLWYIAEWMGHFGRPDIIHWNNGIWDVYRQNDEMGIFTSLDDYMSDIRRLYAEMKKSGARIIFATTTPVGDAFRHISNEDIDRYNAAVLEFLKPEHVPINDLNRLIRQDKAGLLGKDMMHLSPDGIELAARQTASLLESLL